MSALHLRVVAAAGIWIIPAICSASDKFQRFDFSLRFPAALSRVATYGDVAGVGGASAASRFQSSVNPAAAAWSLDRNGALRVSASPQATQVNFDRGQRFTIGVGTLGFGAYPYGDIQLSVAKVGTNRSSNTSGTPFYFKTELAQAQWGVSLGELTSVGLSYSFSESFTELGDPRTFTIATRGRSHAFRGGLLTQLSSGILAGLVLEHSTSPSRTSLFDAATATSTDLVSDRTRQDSARAGFTWEYLPESTIYLDAQKIAFANDSGRLRASRFYGGIEHRLIDGAFARAGAVADTRGTWSFSGGLGIYPTKQISFDIAYQRHMFPELMADFGRSHLFTLSASIGF